MAVGAAQGARKYGLDHAREGNCKEYERMTHKKLVSQAAAEKNKMTDGQEDATENMVLGSEDKDEVNIVNIAGISESDLAAIVDRAHARSPRVSRKTDSSPITDVLPAIPSAGAVISPPLPQHNMSTETDKPSHPPTETEAVQSSYLQCATSSSSATLELQRKVTAKKPRFESPGRTDPKTPSVVLAKLPFVTTRRSTPLDLLAAEPSSSAAPSQQPSLAAEEFSPELTAFQAPALVEFFRTIRVPLQHLAPVFIQYGFCPRRRSTCSA
ncbi:uncharacterized protein PHACADRAFT_190764 [Phanerochaete carnosa HHB-10118-sp]|uniref:Uncharacterized protein n=1 Tax=Phanerochaete carnosa (strain HHB-10118-sp) TaxID=650164 RepID=K5WC98_PHACS|nr:uncharacterized protein PHACADRAFT_190764 [Phanerochaete carnosa HHB-10118-sp]EKM61588.1 hypothetical protein PHACADRAFT_190764 [Phanerochaete carnosa HHB-10118-sp]